MRFHPKPKLPSCDKNIDENKGKVFLAIRNYNKTVPYGVVHKLRLQDGIGRWSENVLFLSTVKCQRRRVDGQKSQNFVYIVCERPLSICAVI